MNSIAVNADEIKKLEYIILANKKEHYFTYSDDVSLMLLKASGTPGVLDDEIQDAVADEIGDLVSKLPLKSRIISRFQRFGEDADYDAEEAEAIVSAAFIEARHEYMNQGELDNISFKEALINRVNESIGEAYFGDAVTEWALFNDIDQEIKTLLKDTESSYGVIFNKEVVVDRVMDACDAACEEFLKGHDTSNGLDLLSKDGNIEILISTGSLAIDDGQNSIVIKDFNEFGVGGVRPTNSVLEFMGMTGVTPSQLKQELRDEMDPDVMMEWAAISDSQVNYRVSKGAVDVQDMLDIIEQCGEKGGVPCFVIEANPALFSQVDAGDKLITNKAGITMLPHDVSIELPGVKVIEEPIEIDYNPGQIIPPQGFGLEYMKSSSLKKGELDGRLKKINLQLDAENHQDIGP